MTSFQEGRFQAPLRTLRKDPRKVGCIGIRTDDIGECERFAEEVAIGPPIVVLEIVDQVVEQELLLLFLLHFGANTHVQVHHEGMDLAGLPILPQPSRHVEQDRLRLKKKEQKQKYSF